MDIDDFTEHKQEAYVVIDGKAEKVFFEGKGEYHASFSTENNKEFYLEMVEIIHMVFESPEEAIKEFNQNYEEASTLKEAEKEIKVIY